MNGLGSSDKPSRGSSYDSQADHEHPSSVGQSNIVRGEGMATRPPFGRREPGKVKRYQ
jgi:hypothetical protein